MQTPTINDIAKAVALERGVDLGEMLDGALHGHKVAKARMMAIWIASRFYGYSAGGAAITIGIPRATGDSMMSRARQRPLLQREAGAIFARMERNETKERTPSPFEGLESADPGPLLNPADIPDYQRPAHEIGRRMDEVRARLGP